MLECGMPIDVSETPALPPGRPAFVVDAERPVLTHGRDLEAETSIAPHSHPRGQLLWAAEGVLRVTTPRVVWIVPPSHAVWIPGGVHHQVATETAARTRNLYVDPSYPVRVQDMDCAMLLLTPLMREIILRLTSETPFDDREGEKRLGWVAIDEIRRLDSAALGLPSGRDERLRRLIGHLVRTPHEQRPLAELVRLAGTSLRTIERLFRDETGMTFRQWRSRLRLLSAIEHLEKGKSSTFVAYTLGYQGASSFVSAFRKAFGCTPQQFSREARLGGAATDS